jgi:hypothetical protein
MVSGGSGALPAKAQGWAASGAPTILFRPDSGELAASRQLGDVGGSWGSIVARFGCPRRSSGEHFIGELCDVNGRESQPDSISNPSLESMMFGLDFVKGYV